MTAVPCSRWRKGTSACRSAVSKLKLQPIRKAGRGLRWAKSSMSYAQSRGRATRFACVNPLA